MQVRPENTTGSQLPHLLLLEPLCCGPPHTPPLPCWPHIPSLCPAGPPHTPPLLCHYVILACLDTEHKQAMQHTCVSEPCNSCSFWRMSGVRARASRCASRAAGVQPSVFRECWVSHTMAAAVTHAASRPSAAVCDSAQASRTAESKPSALASLEWGQARGAWYGHARRGGWHVRTRDVV